jgi:hypothetical protein
LGRGGSRMHRALPLPGGERVGVRGFGSFRKILQHPNPLTLARFAHSTSPLRGEVK